MGKILVTGATGGLGRGVLNHLLENTSADQLAALVRTPAKASDLQDAGVELRQGDYDDPESLKQAFQDVDKLYFVSGSEVERRGAQHQKVVEAARAAQVGHIFYTSFQRPGETANPALGALSQTHLDTERWLKESGLTYTLLQHNLYLEVLPLFLGDQVLETGMVYLPAGEGRVAYALRNELAEAGAKILLGQGHENRSYRLSGAEAVSFAQVAAAFAEASGKPVVYVDPSPEEYKKQLSQIGVPPAVIDLALGFSLAIGQGEFEAVDPQLETLLGRRPTSAEAFVKQWVGQA